jgi:hypothetical protein
MAVVCRKREGFLKCMRGGNKDTPEISRENSN